MTRMFVNVFDKPTSNKEFAKYEEDLRELLPLLSSTVGNIIAIGKKILNAETDEEFVQLRSEIDDKLPNTDQRIKTVVLIVLYCAYQVAT